MTTAISLNTTTSFTQTRESSSTKKSTSLTASSVEREYNKDIEAASERVKQLQDGLKKMQVALASLTELSDQIPIQQTKLSAPSFTLITNGDNSSLQGSDYVQVTKLDPTAADVPMQIQVEELYHAQEMYISMQAPVLTAHGTKEIPGSADTATSTSQATIIVISTISTVLTQAKSLAQQSVDVVGAINNAALLLQKNAPNISQVVLDGENKPAISVNLFTEVSSKLNTLTTDASLTDSQHAAAAALYARIQEASVNVTTASDYNKDDVLSILDKVLESITDDSVDLRLNIPANTTFGTLVSTINNGAFGFELKAELVDDSGLTGNKILKITSKTGHEFADYYNSDETKLFLTLSEGRARMSVNGIAHDIFGSNTIEANGYRFDLKLPTPVGTEVYYTQGDQVSAAAGVVKTVIDTYNNLAQSAATLPGEGIPFDVRSALDTLSIQIFSFASKYGINKVSQSYNSEDGRIVSVDIFSYDENALSTKLGSDITTAKTDITALLNNITLDAAIDILKSRVETASGKNIEGVQKVIALEQKKAQEVARLEDVERRLADLKEMFDMQLLMMKALYGMLDN